MDRQSASRSQSNPSATSQSATSRSTPDLDPQVVHTPSRRTASRLPVPGRSSSLVSYDPDLAARQGSGQPDRRSVPSWLPPRLATACERTLDAACAHPLMAGALVATAGLCIGLAVPTTETEDEMMGEASDRLLDDARAGANELLRDGRNVVREATSAVESQVREDLPDAQSLGNAIRRVARAAEEAAQQEADRRGVTPSDLSSRADSALDEVVTIGRTGAASSAAAIARDTPYSIPDDRAALAVEPFDEPPLRS